MPFQAGLFEGLLTPEDAVISDELNHAAAAALTKHRHTPLSP